jgi:hypothetical protein
MTTDINSNDKVNTTTIAAIDKPSEKETAKPEPQWVIFPNPVVDIVRITGLDGSYTIKIVDVVGQVVILVKGSSSEPEIDMSGKPAGIYLIKIEAQGKSITRKLMKK